MLSPAITEPIFECSEYVRLCSIESGSDVSIWVGQSRLGQGQATGGVIVVHLERPLAPGESVAAKAAQPGIPADRLRRPLNFNVRQQRAEGAA